MLCADVSFDWHVSRLCLVAKGLAADRLYTWIAISCGTLIQRCSALPVFDTFPSHTGAHVAALLLLSRES